MPSSHTGVRLALIDAFRGVAIVLMVVFHFCFDLSYLGLAGFDFYNDRFWLNARTFILSTFLFLVGVGLSLASASGLNWRRYFRRLGMIALGALVVSLSTRWIFAERFVFFGVLHFITLASVVALPFMRAGALNLLLGIAVILLGSLYQSPWFDQAGWRWVGLMTHKPLTEDYVPLLPWFGVVLLGIYSGPAMRCLAVRWQAWAENTAGVGLLSLAGRFSLWIYLLHQPALIGGLSAYVKLSA